MYALFAVCHALSPSRLDDNIENIAKERYGEQFAKMARGGDDALPAFQELFLYACPKFINATSPPYDDAVALASILTPPSPSGATPEDPILGQADPAHRHLRLFLSDIQAQAPIPTLRSFLKLYTSLGAKKLANFLDADEEDMVQEMMAMKQCSRSVSRVGSGAGAGEGSLLDGETISTSDLNFVIDENMLHIAESTVGRRYAGWFIKNTERTQRIFEDLRNTPLPAAPPQKAAPATSAPAEGGAKGPRTSGQKVAWGGVKVA